MRTRGVAARCSAVLLLAASLSACATTASLRNARRAEDRQDYDIAVLEYTRVLQRDPDNADARGGLQRAKLRAAQDHFTRARRLAALGRLDEAVAEYQLAAELNPANGEIAEELRTTQNLLRAKISVSRDGRTELEALIDRMRNQPPPGLDLPNDPLPDNWLFKDAPVETVIRAIAQASNVNIIFDPAFQRTVPITIDLRNSTFDQALTSITRATRNFYRVTAPRTVTIIPDTPAKRREYEQEILRTFYLSNADPKEAMDLLRVVTSVRFVGLVTATNAITVVGPEDRVAAAARLIGMIDKARPEVLIDVELLEINRTKLTEYGLQLASAGSPGINGTADVNRPGLTLENLRNLTESQVFLTVPSLFYRLLKSDQSTRVLANTQLRTFVGIAAQARFGERVPVPVTTFSPIATGGVAQQPITSFNYENIGVNIDITPRTHMDNDVSLGLAIGVSSISGTGFGGLPTFANREINTQIRLKDGETNMLAGLIRDDERRLREGIPGLSDIPGVGHVLGRTRRDRTQTDVILMLTPHIVRVLELTEDDLRGFQIGRESEIAAPGAGFPAGGIDLPGGPRPGMVPDSPVPPPAPAPSPKEVEPIRPPAPTPQQPPAPGTQPPR